MGAVDTFKTWASQLTSESEIPDEFRATFRSLRLDAAVFPVVLFCPAFRFDWFESPPRLLVITPQQIICLERLRNAVVRADLRCDAIHAVEWGAILLDGWIRLLGTGERGRTSIQVDFNRCSRELFLPLLGECRRLAYGDAEEDARQDPSPFDALRDVDFKFMSYARETLRPGMEVRRHYLQSSVSRSTLGLFQQLRIAGAMLIATQRELIVIREGDGHAPGEDGGVWSYVRLDRIERLELQPAPGREVIQLGILLPGETKITCDCLPGKEPELRAFIEELRSAWPLIQSDLQSNVN